MEQGTLLKQARIDTRIPVTGTVVLLVVCAAVLAVNWMYAARPPSRWDSNLFVVVAAGLFPLLLAWLALALWLSRRVERHSALAGLKQFGPPARVLEDIENDMRQAGAKSHAGPLWVSSSWVVVLAGSLRVFAVTDVIGVGFEATRVRVWPRGRLVSHDFEVREADLSPILVLVLARLPWTIVEDTSVFERMWRQDRVLCERLADERRALRSDRS